MNTEEQQKIINKIQACLGVVPTVILGSGASAKYGMPGMNQLKEHLLKDVSPEITDRDKWIELCNLLNDGIDLETALQQVQLSDNLLEKVCVSTAKLINEADYNVFLKILTDYSFLSLSSLFKKLFNTTHKKVSVITTNYDRLCEYAVDAANFSCYTGFGDGYIRFPSDDLSSNQRVVELWKVHGSLDWHKDQKGSTVSFPYLNALPESFKPLIVTPGIRKYEDTHNQPYRSVLQSADTAIKESRSFLVWGYGFRDKHIQTEIQSRVYSDETPILVLSRTLSKEARDFLFDDQCKNFVAIEKCKKGSVAYSSEYKAGVVFEDVDLWDLDEIIKVAWE